MENVHRRMRVYMNTAEGEVRLRRKRGVREGATDGPGLFTRGYAQPMKQFSNDVGNSSVRKPQAQVRSLEDAI